MAAEETVLALQVVGLSFKLPPKVESTADVWDALVRGDVAIRNPPAGFKGLPAGYLSPPFDSQAARAAARACGVEGAEATAMDLQHALALDLAKKMWEDAGPAVSALAKSDLSRVGECCSAVALSNSIPSPNDFKLHAPDSSNLVVSAILGVYIGAWQQPASAPRSAYRVLGNSLSALAARVANAFAITGPAVTVNTACSSSLVAMDAALRDARTGRIDFAIEAAPAIERILLSYPRWA